MDRKCYATILSTDSYLPGVLALFESIRKTNTKITEFVVVVNQDIKKETINRLEKNGIIVKQMSKIKVPQRIKSKNKLFPHWNNTFDKFNIFDLTDYDKVVYVDSDIFVADKIDELFEKPNMSAVVAGKSYPFNTKWNELNSGLMVIEPKKGMRDNLIGHMSDFERRKRTLRKPHKQESKRFFSSISLLKIKDRICKFIQGVGDQDILEDFFHWKEQPELHLDEQYNVFSKYADYYEKKLGIKPKCYHFIGAKKPWSLTPKELLNKRKNLSGKKDVENEVFEKYIKTIYDIAEKDKTNFSIIIPMKNAENDIKEALASIKNQKYENIEILVIDDNSTDSSRQSVEKFREENPKIADKIKLLSTEEGHRGPGAARNVGLEEATGDYILFLDADDQLNKGALNNISRTISLNPEADIFSLGYQLTSLGFNGEEVSTLKLNAGALQESRFFQVGANTAGQIWNVCARRSLFETPKKLRFKENCIFEDLPTKVELFTRTKKKIKSVRHITHTQYSRPAKSITGTIKFRDIKRLIEANVEIANIRPEVAFRDKMYINARMVMMPVILGWFVQKCIQNRINFYKMSKKVEKER